MRPLSLATLAATLAAGLLVSPTGTPELAQARAAPPRHMTYHQWDTGAQLSQGAMRGVSVAGGAVRLERPYRSGSWDKGIWTSPWQTPGFGLTELVASWKAATPGASRIRVQVRGRDAGGTTTSWDTLALWAYGDRALRRTSGAAQTDDGGRVSYDTWITTSGAGMRSWQVRAILLRPAGGTAVPSLGTIGATVSRLGEVRDVATSAPRPSPNPALGTVLPVPRYSQMEHRGHHPQYDGGGAAWCSPTSVSMVLGYYDALPSEKAMSWISSGHADRVVDHAARMTYDARLGGTGNWAFSTAYAASLAGRGDVRRMRDLRAVERWIQRGVPVVVSVRFGRGELSGSPLTSTNGHLLVVVGFTRSGDPVVNDPAASTRSGVRRVYDRGQLEDAWLQRYSSGGSMRGSGGVAYIIRR